MVCSGFLAVCVYGFINDILKSSQSLCLVEKGTIKLKS